MPRSQCQAINEANYKSWNEYRRGCLSTFAGGYYDAKELRIFQHGMNAVFNLLEKEFPQPYEIFAANPPLNSDPEKHRAG